MTSELQPLTENEYGAVGKINFTLDDVPWNGSGGFIEGEDGYYYFLTAAHVVKDLEQSPDESQRIYSSNSRGFQTYYQNFSDESVFIYPDYSQDIAIIRLGYQDLALQSDNFFKLNNVPYQEGMDLSFYLGSPDIYNHTYSKYTSSNNEEIENRPGYFISDVPVVEGNSGGLVTYQKDEEQYIVGVIVELAENPNQGVSNIFSADVLSFLEEITDSDQQLPNYDSPKDFNPPTTEELQKEAERYLELANNYNKFAIGSLSVAIICFMIAGIAGYKWYKNR